VRLEVKKDKNLNPDDNFGKLKLFHVDCEGGEILIKRESEKDNWMIECKRCGRSETIYQHEIPIFFQVALRGGEENYSNYPGCRVACKE
jgi:hypothetical protein